MKFNDRIWSLPDEIGILHNRPKFREKKSRKEKIPASRNRQDRKGKPAAMTGEELDPSGDNCPQNLYQKAILIHPLINKRYHAGCNRTGPMVPKDPKGI